MKRGFKVNKIEPFEERGENYYRKGFKAVQLTVIENSDNPELITREYVDSILKKLAGDTKKIENRKIEIIEQ